MNVLLLYPEFSDTFWSFKHDSVRKGSSYVSVEAVLSHIVIMAADAASQFTHRQTCLDHSADYQNFGLELFFSEPANEAIRFNNDFLKNIIYLRPLDRDLRASPRSSRYMMFDRPF